MPNLGYEEFESRWIDHTDLRDVVRRESVGRMLNFPCGQSPLGDIRADADDKHNPDVVADLRNPPFKAGEFDTVYCDPPYSMFDFGESLEWVKDLYEIADKCLIIQGPNKAVRVGAPSTQKLIALKPRPGSTKHWIRMLQVFRHPDSSLSDFE